MIRTLVDGSSGELPIYVEESPYISPTILPDYPSNGRGLNGIEWGVIIFVVIVVFALFGVWFWVWKQSRD